MRVQLTRTPGHIAPWYFWLYCGAPTALRAHAFCLSIGRWLLSIQL